MMPNCQNKCKKCIVYFPEIINCLTNNMLVPLANVASVLRSLIDEIHREQVSNEMIVNSYLSIEDTINWLKAMREKNLLMNNFENNNNKVVKIVDGEIFLPECRRSVRIDLMHEKFARRKIFVILKNFSVDNNKNNVHSYYLKNISYEGGFAYNLICSEKYKNAEYSVVIEFIDIKKNESMACSVFIKLVNLQETGTGFQIVGYPHRDSEMFYVFNVFNLYKILAAD